MPSMSRSGSFSGGTGNSLVAKTFEEIRSDFNPTNHALHHEVSIGLHSSRKHYFKCSEETKNDRLARIANLKAKSVKQRRQIEKRIEFMRL